MSFHKIPKGWAFRLMPSHKSSPVNLLYDKLVNITVYLSSVNICWVFSRKLMGPKKVVGSSFIAPLPDAGETSWGLELVLEVKATVLKTDTHPVQSDLSPGRQCQNWVAWCGGKISAICLRGLVVQCSSLRVLIRRRWNFPSLVGPHKSW